MSEDQEELKKVLKKIAGYLSRRSYSKEELKFKLSKKFPLNIIEQALKKAKQSHWLETEKELAEKLVSSLHKKDKSWNYIKKYLYEKKLPLPVYDRGKELEKAKNLVSEKYSSLKDMSLEQRIKLKRFLSYKGFEEDVVEDLLR